MTFTNLEDVVHAASEVDSELLIYRWLDEFISKPHPLLIREGRNSGVCPCADESLRKKSIFFVKVDLHSENGDKKSTLKRKVEALIQEILDKVGDYTEIDRYFSLLIIVLGLKDYEYRYVLDGSVREIKAHSINNGFLIGSFHRLSNRTSRLAKDLYCLRSPVPFIALRKLAPTDWMSLDGNTEYLEAFRKHYSGLES